MAQADQCLFASSPKPGRRSWPTVAGWLAVALTVVSLSAAAGAQEYRSDPVDARAKANSGIVTLCVRNPANYATEKARFAEYFSKYYFPAMTLYGADDLASLGSLRFDLFSRYLWKSTSEELQRDLTDLAYQAVGRIIVADNPPYHPAVRYNAVLMLGLLDEQYAIDAGPNRRPPRPLPKANEVLTKIVDMATTTDRFPPPVIVGALVGLDRHAQYRESLSPQAAEAMAAAVLKIINRNEPIQDVEPDVYTWMQLQAASVLANLGTVGTNNQNLNGLMKLIAGNKSLDDRCRVAAMLAKINFEGTTIDSKATVDPLLQLVLDVSKEEAQRARTFQQNYLSGDVGRGRDRVEKQTYDRRGLLARLVNLRSGLQAVEPVAPEAAKQQLAAIVAAINVAAGAAEDDATIDLDVAAKVVEMAGAIQGVVGPASSPASGDAQASS